MIRLLFGCEPDKYSSTKLNINAGSIGSFYGDYVWDLPQETQIDLTVIGPWGIDKPLVYGQELYVYFIRNPTTDTNAFMCSGAKYAGDVVYPAGFVFMRKLPWGVMTNLGNEVLPNFHLSCWPLPYIRLTDSEYSSTWMPLAQASNPNWTLLDVSHYLPDNSRLIDINVEVRFQGSGSAGSAYLSSTGNGSGLFCGSANPYAGSFSSQTLRVTSDRHLYWKTTGNVWLYVGVKGYWMSEPA